MNAAGAHPGGVRRRVCSSLALGGVLILGITACPQTPQVQSGGNLVTGRLMRSDNAKAASASLSTSRSSTSSSSASSLGSAAQAARVPGELVVRYRDGRIGLQGAQPAAIRSERSLGSASLLTVAVGSEEAVRAQLAADPNVAAVGPNYRYKRLATPNDSEFSQQTNLGLIGAPAAWDIQKGASGVLVAVLDDGYNPNQPDMVSRIALPIPKSGLWLDPGNGDNQPTEFQGDNSNPPDTHGGGVASVIAAQTDNGLGIAGVAWQGVQVVPIKIFTDPGSTVPSGGTTAIIAAALDTAINLKANVINMSFCLVDSNNLCTGSSDPVIDAQLQAAYASGAVMVAASGNDGAKPNYVPGTVAYPASNRYVLAAGSIEDSLGRSDFSNYGPNLDLVAPGRDVWVLSGTGMAQESGTSFSSPTVAGVAALLRSNGLSSPDVIEARLLETAQDLGASGRDDQTGNGLVRADLALAGPNAAQGYPVTTTVMSSTTVVQTVTSSLQPGRSMGAYSLNGLAAGTYTLNVWVDVNRDGTQDSGDLIGQRSLSITSLPTYGQDVTLNPVP